MRTVIWLLVALSILGFVLAIVGVFGLRFGNITPEGISRGSHYFVLLAIVLALLEKK
jgi:hypothetical protein